METELQIPFPTGSEQGHRTDRHAQRGEVQRRVIDRREREIPAESSVWFNLGLAAAGIAAGAAIAAATVVKSPVTEAILWTVSVCALVTGLSCFAAHRDVNRGRRVKHSQVIEDVKEI